MSKLISKKEKEKMLNSIRLDTLYCHRALSTLQSETVDANVKIKTLVLLLIQEIKASNAVVLRKLTMIRKKGTFD